jgi:hypothetical protein
MNSWQVMAMKMAYGSGINKRNQWRISVMKYQWHQ